MTGPAAPYANRTGRPPGRFVQWLGTVLPGVASVRAQAEPYADAWHARNQQVLAAEGGGRRWVVLGDSMSQGLGASSPDAGLVGQLLARLNTHDLAVVNLSATGARVADVIEQQLPVLRALGAPADAAAPDLVTVLIGSNDLFGGRRHRDALPATMRRLVDLLPHDAVVATLPQPRAAARLANVPLDEAAAAHRIRLVDLRVSGPTSWRGRLAADFFHPNDAGYAALADAFEPTVRAVLDDAVAGPR